jgi:glucose-6-phosphate isomerase
MYTLVDSVIDGSLRSASGEAFTDVVNIGIGGSDLGPAMAYQALAHYHQNRVSCHFVSNVDPDHLHFTLKALNPNTTLFIVASKSFTTLETLSNAEAAKHWLEQHFANDEQLHNHFIAVTSKPDRAEAFGIAGDKIFPMWDWVGGRYSLWSAIGLPLALAFGREHFDALLAGAHAMDKHFQHEDYASNLPVLLALLSIWNHNILGINSLAVIPYSQQLAKLPAYLQQLVMESNGKSVSKDGVAIEHQTSPILWGEAGTNGQHSFFQLLHQGTQTVAVDFILPLCSDTDKAGHRKLVANCLAQAQALMQGQSQQDVLDREPDSQAITAHKLMPGNKPSNMISMQRLTPETLGALLALYEHKTFVESWIWDINAFDQWGVELGKRLCSDILSAMGSEPDRVTDMDASTAALIASYRKANIATGS